MAIPANKVEPTNEFAGKVLKAFDELKLQWPEMTVEDMEQVITAVELAIRENRAKELMPKNG